MRDRVKKKGRPLFLKCLLARELGAKNPASGKFVPYCESGRAKK